MFWNILAKKQYIPLKKKSYKLHDHIHCKETQQCNREPCPFLLGLRKWSCPRHMSWEKAKSFWLVDLPLADQRWGQASSFPGGYAGCGLGRKCHFREYFPWYGPSIPHGKPSIHRQGFQIFIPENTHWALPKERTKFILLASELQQLHHVQRSWAAFWSGGGGQVGGVSSSLDAKE